MRRGRNIKWFKEVRLQCYTDVVVVDNRTTSRSSSVTLAAALRQKYNGTAVVLKIHYGFHFKHGALILAYRCGALANARWTNCCNAKTIKRIKITPMALPISSIVSRKKHKLPNIAKATLHLTQTSAFLSNQVTSLLGTLPWIRDVPSSAVCLILKSTRKTGLVSPLITS